MRISDWSSDGCSSDLAVVMAFSRRCGVGEIRQLITQRRLRNRVIERSVIRQKLSSFDAISHIQLFQHLTHPLVDRVRRDIHQTRNLLGVLLLIDVPHGFNLRLRKQRSEEHTSELQSLMRISYAVFCWKKKNNTHTTF